MPALFLGFMGSKWNGSWLRRGPSSFMLIEINYEEHNALDIYPITNGHLYTIQVIFFKKSRFYKTVVIQRFLLCNLIVIHIPVQGGNDKRIKVEVTKGSKKSPEFISEDVQR